MLEPTPPPYDPLEWVQKPLPERGRMVCEAWALQGYGTPVAAYLLYAFKVVFYIGVWALACGRSPSLGGLDTIATWWLHPLAFQKAILWSMLFEVLGLGCGSGPLTGRYWPPVGGFLYFLRPGTTKLPLVRALGHRRSLVDVLLYAALIGVLGWGLVAETTPREALVAAAVLLPILGVLDKTLFLAARGEHYWVTILVFVFAENWIPGAQAVQLALWFWAGMSKLNHHFPAVVCVMTSNSPITRFAWMRKLVYRSYPDDLRPSRLAVIMGHMGTALELGVPIAFVLAGLGVLGPHGLTIALVLMVLLHGYITSNVPMGVPIEWNFMVVYGGFALFGAHPDVMFTDLDVPLLGVALGVFLVGVPLVGNLVPERVSFLWSMRYYAGNWAYGVWLFKGESYRKLEKLTTSASWVYDQLDRFYDRPTSIGLVGKVLGFRMMHLHGRALPRLIPKAVSRLQDYEYLDGEIVAGLVLGWNFGDGHLHNEKLIRAVQPQCDFEPGEVRCIFVESQPLFRSSLKWRIVDVASGEIERGEVSVDELRRVQPWATGETVKT